MGATMRHMGYHGPHVGTPTPPLGGTPRAALYCGAKKKKEVTANITGHF